MFNERLAKRLAIEDFLNQKSYQQVPMGALCSHTINKLIINGIHFNWKKMLMEWIWIFTRVGIGSDAKLNQCKHLFLLSNETERGKSQFALIQPLMENKGGLFLLVSKFYKKVSPSTYLKWIIRFLAKLPGFYSIIRACNKKHQCFNAKQRITLLHVFAIQSLKYEIARSNIKATAIQNVVVDLDRGYFQAPIVLAANTCNRNSVTFIHGNIFPPYLYLPVIAKKLFCWGQFHVDFFKAYDPNQKIAYYITGNTAFKKQENKPASFSNEPKTVTFISQNFWDDVQFGAIESFCKSVSTLGSTWKGFVKAHPADNKERIQEILQRYTNVELMPQSVNLAAAIDLTDLFVIVSSTFAFDAIMAKKPVAFWYIDDEKAGIAKIFQENAQALLLDSSEQLTQVLQECSAKGIDHVVNLEALTKFGEQYCAFADEAAAQQIQQKLISFEN